MTLAKEVSAEDFRKEWLGEVLANKPSSIDKGHRFARKLVTQWLDIEQASEDLVYCDGSGDGGIDIAYLDRGQGSEGEGDAPEGHTWYLVQSKYGRAFAGTNTILEESQKVIDTLDGRRARLSSLAEGLLERLTTFRRQASERDRIVLIFATEEALTEEQKRALNDVRNMGRGRLGSLFDVDAVSIDNIRQRLLSEQEVTLPALKVPLRTNIVKSGEELLVGSTSLTALYDFLKAYRQATGDLDRLYERNVRLFLGSRGKVNKAMQQTLKDTPERFGLYNNGITIVVADFRPKDGTIELVEPHVVNGCQTTRTIWEVLHQRFEAGGTGSDPALEGWRERAAEGVIVTKIVKVGAGGDPLLEAITRYTNSQNAVREKDFLALTSDSRGWAGQMADRYDVFLELQRGGWDSQSAKQRQDPTIRQFHLNANCFDLLKVYGAGWLTEAGTAFGRNAAFLPNGSVFKRIVNREGDEEAFDVEDLYAAYRLNEEAHHYKFGGQAEVPSRRQTRFVFFTIVIVLLRVILMRASMPRTPKTVTRALIRLSSDSNEGAFKALLDAAVEVIDEYLTPDSDDSVFHEPVFKDLFNNDLNGYLKWEQLGKTEEASPRFRDLLAAHRRTLGRMSGGQISPRDLITRAIKS